MVELINNMNYNTGKDIMQKAGTVLYKGGTFYSSTELQEHLSLGVELFNKGLFPVNPKNMDEEKYYKALRDNNWIRIGVVVIADYAYVVGPASRKDLETIIEELYFARCVTIDGRIEFSKESDEAGDTESYYVKDYIGGKDAKMTNFKKKSNNKRATSAGEWKYSLDESVYGETERWDATIDGMGAGIYFRNGVFKYYVGTVVNGWSDTLDDAKRQIVIDYDTYKYPEKYYTQFQVGDKIEWSIPSGTYRGIITKVEDQVGSVLRPEGGYRIKKDDGTEEYYAKGDSLKKIGNTMTTKQSQALGQDLRRFFNDGDFPVRLQTRVTKYLMDKGYDLNTATSIIKSIISYNGRMWEYRKGNEKNENIVFSAIAEMMNEIQPGAGDTWQEPEQNVFKTSQLTETLPPLFLWTDVDGDGVMHILHHYDLWYTISAANPLVQLNIFAGSLNGDKIYNDTNGSVNGCWEQANDFFQSHKKSGSKNAQASNWVPDGENGFVKIVGTWKLLSFLDKDDNKWDYEVYDDAGTMKACGTTFDTLQEAQESADRAYSQVVSDKTAKKAQVLSGNYIMANGQKMSPMSGYRLLWEVFGEKVALEDPSGNMVTMQKLNQGESLFAFYSGDGELIGTITTEGYMALQDYLIGA